jgi:hypothetical protein
MRSNPINDAEKLRLGRETGDRWVVRPRLLSQVEHRASRSRSVGQSGILRDREAPGQRPRGGYRTTPSSKHLALPI